MMKTTLPAWTPRLVISLSFLVTGAATAQVPLYTAQVLGPGYVINDMNLGGDVVGWGVDGTGKVQAFITRPRHSHEFLPRPAGYSSAWAQGVNDLGVVVGSAATGNFPEFGQAVAWTPNGAGGWTIQFLGQLPGHTQSIAYDVNNRGNIIGMSLTPGFGGGPTVWFNSPSGILNISALAANAPSSPKEINDEGVIVGINGQLFDIDTLSVIPLPAFTGSMNMFQGWAINDTNELAGTAFFGGSARSASNWTIAGGWKSVSGIFGISANVTAFDINGDGLTVFEGPFPAAYFPGVGAFGLASLLGPAQQDKWAFNTSFGGAVNDNGQIATSGSNLQTGKSGVVLLSPVEPEPDPFTDVGSGLAGSLGTPHLSGTGTLQPATPVSVALSGAPAMKSTTLVVGYSALNVPFKGGVLVPNTDLLLGGLVTNGSGGWSLASIWPTGVPSGFSFWMQAWIADVSGPAGYIASNGLRAITP